MGLNLPLKVEACAIIVDDAGEVCLFAARSDAKVKALVENRKYEMGWMVLDALDRFVAGPFDDVEAANQLRNGVNQLSHVKKALNTVKERLHAFEAYISERACCPDCGEEGQCKPTCTIQFDDPLAYEEMMEARDVLWGSVEDAV